MNIEKLFQNLNRHKALLIYLFEHRDRVVYVSEVEELSYENSLEVLENFELIELNNEKLFLDSRVVSFLEEYIDGSDTIEISGIFEKIESIKHKLEILSEYKHKYKEIIPKIRRELKKIDATLFQNLDKLRVHIDRVYKSIDTFSLKLKELEYYKTRLKEYQNALDGFENFLKLHTPMMKSYYDHDLNTLLESIYENKISLSRSLIPLTQDVIEYINQAQKQSIFIEKILKLKELKDNYELKNATNIEEKVEEFTLRQESLRIGSKLHRDLLYSETFYPTLHKISSKAKIKTHKADKIEFVAKERKQDFISVAEIHLAFGSSKSSLMEFLLDYNKLKEKDMSEISTIYCKMILLYEDEYKISSEFFEYKNQKFAKVYYDNRFR